MKTKLTREQIDKGICLLALVGILLFAYWFDGNPKTREVKIDGHDYTLVQGRFNESAYHHDDCKVCNKPYYNNK